MSILMQLSPFDYFTDLKGDALDEGYIWIGQPNKNPQSFPVTVYLDAALTIPAAQPLRTNAGYIVRGNSPTFLYINGNYSVLVEDKKHRQVYYIADFLLTGNSGAVSQDDLSNTTDPYKGAGIVGRMPLIIENVTELRATPGRRQFDRCILMNYNDNDTKARGRYLTWVPGASSDDGGMKFAATGGTWFSDLNEDGRVCSEFYGLPLAAGVSCITQDAAIEAYCYTNKVSAWYGPGPDQAQWPATYDYGVNNWSWSGVRIAAQALKDYRGVRIYSCPSVTFKTSSALGADVMQCCGIKNFGVIGFPKVTATLSGATGSGSNALSLVFGAVDCIFELDIHDMPGIYKADGSIDGGQGFSVQPGAGNTNPYKNVRLIGSVDGATQGFGCDFALDDQVALPITGVRLDLSIRNCYRGVAIGGAAATVAHTPKAYIGITGSVRIENCQQSFVNIRSVGTSLDAEVVNTLPKASLVKHSFNPSVIVSMILAAKDGGARITGRVLTVDTVLQIGGASMGGGDFGTTENFTLLHSVSFTGATNQVVVTDSGGNAVDKSDISLFNLASGYSDLSIKGGNTVKVDGCLISPTSYPGDNTITAVRGPRFTAIFSAALTAVRAVTFVSGPRAGDVVRVVRLASATGGGVSVGGLTNILAGTWAEATYSGSAWAITGQGGV